MKNLYAILVFLIFTTSYSQQLTIRGLVKDAATNQPVESASVAVENSGNGSITNEEGVFQLSVSNNAIIVISYLGYKTQKIPVSEFIEGTKTIMLVQDDEMIEEVMVTKIPLYEILRDVARTSTARFNKPIVLHTYYREFVKMNEKYTKFSDGLLDYHLSGSVKKTNSDLIVKQNRSIFLPTDEDERDDDSGSLQNVGRAVSASYSFEYLSERILKEKYVADYDFELKSKKDKEGNEMFAITFTPKAEVEKMLYKGTVIYDPKSKLIYDIDLYVDPAHLKYPRTLNLLLIKASYLDSKYHASYKVVNNNYMMSYNNRYGKMRIWNKKHNYLFESRSDLIVTNFEKDNFTYDKKEVYKKNDLYSKPTHYTEKFWQKNNAIVLTAEEERIISSLEKAAVVAPN